MTGYKTRRERDVYSSLRNTMAFLVGIAIAGVIAIAVGV